MSIIFWYIFLFGDREYLFIASSSPSVTPWICAYESDWVASRCRKRCCVLCAIIKTPITAAAAVCVGNFRDDEPDVWIFREFFLYTFFCVPCSIWKMKKLRSLLFWQNGEHIHIQRSPQDSHTPHWRSFFYDFFFILSVATCKCSQQTPSIEKSQIFITCRVDLSLTLDPFQKSPMCCWHAGSVAKLEAVNLTFWFSNWCNKFDFTIQKSLY